MCSFTFGSLTGFLFFFFHFLHITSSNLEISCVCVFGFFCNPEDPKNCSIEYTKSAVSRMTGAHIRT